MRIRTRIAIAGALAIGVLAGTSACTELQALADDIVREIPAPTPTDQPTRMPDDAPLRGTVAPPVTTSFDQDYFSIIGTAERAHDPAPGEIGYCPLDELDRATCAFSLLTGRDDGDREDITFDPPGFADNAETTIPALENVEGSKDYRGWFWNRSHLIADSLGGAATPENMVTGTRTQNVGSTQVNGQFAGGMAHTEVIARDYLDSGQAQSCPLYYAATPQYTGEQLVPTSVIVDIQSCDLSINEKVVVSNSAHGFVIDYATGTWSAMG